MNDRAYQRFAFRVFADFGASIAVPAVLGGLLGKQLDARYGTEPWLTLACLALAFLLTAVNLYQKTKRYANEYAALNQKNTTV